MIGQQVKHALLGVLLQFSYTGVFGWFAGPSVPCIQIPHQLQTSPTTSTSTHTHTPYTHHIYTHHTGFVLLRTGQALPCVLAHAFCNLMGLPNLAPLLAPPRILVTPATVTLYRHRLVFLGLYLLGIALFALTLFPWTDPALFVEGTGRPPLFWRGKG